jgi:hypothetical protein
LANLVDSFGGNVRSWPKAEKPLRRNISSGHWGCCGRDMLAVSLSGFDRCRLRRSFGLDVSLTDDATVIVVLLANVGTEVYFACHWYRPDRTIFALNSDDCSTVPNHCASCETVSFGVFAVPPVRQAPTVQPAKPDSATGSGSGSIRAAEPPASARNAPDRKHSAIIANRT